MRADTLRLLDWAMGPFHETVTRRIVFEKGGQRHTGAPSYSGRRTWTSMRRGREALKEALATLGDAADRHGYLAARECTLGDLALAAHLSALDYFGEVPWKDFSSAAEWYLRVKSRPGFRLAALRPRAGPAARLPLCRARRLNPIRAPLIRARAIAEGFDAVGFARAELPQRNTRASVTRSLPTPATARWIGWRETPTAAPIRGRYGRTPRA